jgi:hypothetical protein
MNNQNLSRMDISQREERRIQANSIINFIFLKLIGYTLTLFIIIIAINSKLRIGFGLIPIIAFELFTLILLCVNNPRPKDDTIYLFMFENFINAFFMLSLLIIFECRMQLIYVLILPAFHLMVNLMSARFQVQQLGFPLFFMNNLVYYTCALFLVLKVTNLLDVSFNVCFWPFYLAGFVVIILVVKNIFEFFKKNIYLIKSFRIIAFKVSIAVMGIMFLLMHVLAIYFLGSILYNIGHDNKGVDVYQMIDVFCALFGYYIFSSIYFAIICNNFG